MGLTLLAHASMPLTYWDHSFTTSVYLISRLPTLALPTYISPYQALYNTTPEYTNLRSFGCACFPNLTPYNKHKLQLHSQECINLGPSTQHKGFKCISSSGRIYISKDVMFHENSFPYTTLFPSQVSVSESSLSLALLLFPYLCLIPLPLALTLMSHLPMLLSATQKLCLHPLKCLQLHQTPQMLHKQNPQTLQMKITHHLHLPLLNTFPLTCLPPLLFPHHQTFTPWLLGPKQTASNLGCSLLMWNLPLSNKLYLNHYGLKQ